MTKEPKAKPREERTLFENIAHFVTSRGLHTIIFFYTYMIFIYCQLDLLREVTSPNVVQQQLVEAYTFGLAGALVLFSSKEGAGLLVQIFAQRFGVTMPATGGTMTTKKDIHEETTIKQAGPQQNPPVTSAAPPTS